MLSTPAAADQRRVAETAWSLRQSTSGRGGRGDVAVAVEGNCADCVMGNCRSENVLRMICAARQIFPQTFDFARDNEIFVPAKRDAVLRGESLRAFGNEVNMWTLAEDLAGSADRICNALDASYAPSPQSTAIHNEGVELDLAVAIQEAAAAGVE